MQSIPDGVRSIYDLGGEVTVYYVPAFLSNERYQELFNAVETSVQREMYGKANSYYEQREDGDWQVSENGKKMPIRTLKKISDAFVENGGMTPEEYYDWQEKAGVEIVETLGFTVALDWVLKGDGVECTIPPELIEERGGGMIYRIQLLPYMAAAGDAENGYMVVPNGSGSLIRFNNGKFSNAQYSQYVYEMDLVDAEYTKTQNLQAVRLPLFAICRENSSVLATIEQGASFANITADVAGRNNSYNNAFTIFTIRGDEKLAMFGAGETADMPIVENDYYFEPLTVRYTLLTEENKGYTGVANYYRERLINEGVLTVKAEGGDVNIRSIPDLDGKDLGTIYEGDTASYLGSRSTDDRGVVWYKVNFDGVVGWVSARYSTLLGAGTSTPSYTSTVEAVGGNCNIRTQPNLSASSIGVMYEGETGTYLNQSSVDERGVTWYKVKFDGKTGWVSSRYSDVY